MKYTLLAFTLCISVSASAGRLINMDDGSTCIVSNDGDVILSCSGGEDDYNERSYNRSYQPQEPRNCEELAIAIRQLEHQARYGNTSEFRRATELGRRYEDIYRDECR